MTSIWKVASEQNWSDKHGGLNGSMQHHLIYIFSLKVVLYEAR